MKRCSKITRGKMTQEELDELQKIRPILSPKEALLAEMNEKNVDRFEKELKDMRAALALDRSGPY